MSLLANLQKTKKPMNLSLVQTNVGKTWTWKIGDGNIEQTNWITKHNT